MTREKRTSRDIQAQERKQQILEAAKALFAENGYHATSVRSINQKVGVADGLTYHYFPKGKLEIIDTILKDGKQQRDIRLREMIETFDRDGSVSEVLMDLAKQIVALIEEAKEMIKIIFREKGLLGDHDQLDLSSGKPTEEMLVLQRKMNGFLRRHAELGVIKDLDFDMAVSQFLSGILLYALKKVLSGESISEEDEQYLNRFVKFTLDLWSS